MERENDKHTPGPWAATRMRIPDKAKDRRCGFVVNGPDSGKDLPVRVCDLRTPRGNSGFQEGRANAALISAAPDMLAALKGLFEHCAMIHKHWGSGSNQTEANAAIVQAEAAIAKATALEGVSC